jgi:ubiquinone/menaquinone biosynthesis C-methylase UbiE
MQVAAALLLTVLNGIPQEKGIPLTAEKPPYVTLQRYDPDGIGVSYMGREIAQVMGHFGAPWLDRPERFAEEAPQILIGALDLKPGMIAVDLGAGSGYLTFPMAKQVAPNGKVLATDIQPEMLAIIEGKKKRLNAKNVETVLGTTTDTGLKNDSADLILLVDVYHEFDKPYEMMTSMWKSLKVGGRLVLVEYRKEDPRVPIKEVHKMSEAQVRKEVEIFPFKWVTTKKNLPRQHIVVFEKIPPKKDR